MSEREKTIAEISNSMRVIKHALHSQLSKVLQDSPVSRAQLELLFVINREQPVSFKRLAETLSLTSGAISQLVEGLETSGLIERKTDSKDRRVQDLSLSKKGQAMFSSIESCHHEMIAEALASLTTSELKTFLTLETKIINNIKK